MYHLIPACWSTEVFIDDPLLSWIPPVATGFHFSASLSPLSPPNAFVSIVSNQSTVLVSYPSLLLRARNIYIQLIISPCTFHLPNVPLKMLWAVMFNTLNVSKVVWRKWPWLSLLLGSGRFKGHQNANDRGSRWLPPFILTAINASCSDNTGGQRRRWTFAVYWPAMRPAISCVSDRKTTIFSSLIGVEPA